MLFSSATFLFFYLPAVLLLCLVLRGWLRIFFLLLTSLLFYAWGEPAAIWLMVLSILIAYTGGMLMERFPERRKAWLWLSAGILLAMLAYFKYAGMVVPGFRVALPIGISFYTFQAIAYAADVYRGDIRAEKDPVQFGTFISGVALPPPPMRCSRFLKLLPVFAEAVETGMTCGFPSRG